MRASLTFVLAASATLAAGLSSPVLAGGFGGGSGGTDKNGDTYLDDAQKNPRFIEPGAQNDPARYRIGAPREGRLDREAAREGYYTYGSGYYPVAPRGGRVTVQPYNR